MWFDMAEWVKTGGVALPELPELVSELTAPTYLFTGGRFQIEPKDQIKQRLGWSPDLGDALALTFAQPVAPKAAMGMPGHGGGRGRAVTEYDPLT